MHRIDKQENTPLRLTEHVSSSKPPALRRKRELHSQSLCDSNVTEEFPRTKLEKCPRLTEDELLSRLQAFRRDQSLIASTQSVSCRVPVVETSASFPQEADRNTWKQKSELSVPLQNDRQYSVEKYAVASTQIHINSLHSHRTSAVVRTHNTRISHEDPPFIPNTVEYNVTSTIRRENSPLEQIIEKDSASKFQALKRKRESR